MIAKTPFKTLLLLMTLSPLGCKKEDTKDPETIVVPVAAEEEKLPSASFTIDKTVYSAGETMQLTNTSTDAGSYRWTLPDGHTEKSTNTSYTIPESILDQSLSVKLEAISPKGTKSDYVVRVIKATKSMGKMVLYTGYVQGSGNRPVTIDGKFHSTVNIPFANQAPACDQSGFPTFELAIGDHLIYIPGSFAPFSKTIQITTNGCTAVDAQ